MKKYTYTPRKVVFKGTVYYTEKSLFCATILNYIIITATE